MISDWTSGYVADIGYTYGYYEHLNPLRAKLAFINSGLRFPEVSSACELGFGQGLSANIHAASSTTIWYGTDFNPSHASFAQKLAADSNNQAKLFDDSFAQFAARTDLPDFDYIGLHGIWSWISDENRAVIVDFIGRKLKPGGVLYVSYNTQPGWAGMVPMRELLTEYCEVMGSSGMGIVNRIDGALDFADHFFKTNPLFLQANPAIANKINKFKGQNRQYLTHEYFNQDWLPMSFSQMAKCLAPAKLNYACSAKYLDHIESVNLTEEHQAFLKEIPDAMFRQTVYDFMINQQFRTDYWVKGVRKLTPLEQAERWRTQKVMLMQSRVDVSFKATGAIGEVILDEAFYGPVLDVLSDHQPRTLAQIEIALSDAKLDFFQIVQAILILSGTGVLALVQEDVVIAQAEKITQQLNFQLMIQARSRNDMSYLASPVTGGGVNVSRMAQIFILSIIQGDKYPEDWASAAYKLLTLQGEHINKDGQLLETPEQNLSEITKQANLFLQKQVPILVALRIL
jgi:SAM-dependent methyltransferase